MNEKTQEQQALELVYDLNGVTESTELLPPLDFQSNGFSSCVKFCGEVIWDDEDTKAPFIDDVQMPLLDWFKQQIERVIKLKQAEAAAILGRPDPEQAIKDAREALADIASNLDEESYPTPGSLERRLGDIARKALSQLGGTR